MKIFNELEEIYEQVYEHPIFTDSLTIKNRKYIDALAGPIYNTPLNTGDTINDLVKYVATVNIAYLNRTYDFHPTIPLLCSPKIADVAIKRYQGGIPILDAERYMTSQNFNPMRKRSHGLFFGYSFAEITSFTKESSMGLLCNLVLNRGLDAPPTLSVMKVLDKVLYLSLGNNFLEESKKARGMPYSQDLISNYAYIDNIHTLQNYLRTQKITKTEAGVLDDLGYVLSTKLGNVTVDICDLLIWRSALKNRDIQITKTIQKKTNVTNINLEIIEDSIKEIKYGLPEDERSMVIQIIIQSELPLALKRSLKESQEA